MNRINRHDYLNHNFVPSGRDEAYFESHRTHSMALDLACLLDTILEAFTNENSSTPLDARGIDVCIEIARHMASDLVSRCERLEEKG